MKKHSYLTMPVSESHSVSNPSSRKRIQSDKILSKLRDACILLPGHLILGTSLCGTFLMLLVMILSLGCSEKLVSDTDNQSHPNKRRIEQRVSEPVRPFQSVRSPASTEELMRSVSKGMSRQDVLGLVGVPQERHTWIPPVYQESELAPGVTATGIPAAPQRQLSENDRAHYEVWTYEVNKGQEKISISLSPIGRSKATMVNQMMKATRIYHLYFERLSLVEIRSERAFKAMTR